jgi:hypothetical protein
MHARSRRVGTENDDLDPVEAPSSDPHPWRLAALLTLLTIGLGMLSSMVLVPLVLHWRGWLAPEDVWPSVLAAQYVANGAVGYVYSSSDFYVVTPLLALILAPAALVADKLNLLNNFPFHIEHPTAWLLYGPYGLALSFPLYWAARKLAVQVGLAARAWVVQWAALILAAIPMSVLYGHYEDTLCLAAVLFAVTLLLQERPLPAALAFGVAIACKQWALLGLPLFVLVAPREHRVGMAVRSLGIPAALVALPLIQDWKFASRALFEARSYPHAIEHSALWVHNTQIVTGTPGRIVAVLFGVGVAWWLRDRDELPLLLAGFGLIFLSRLVFEPRILFYYLGPGLLFLMLHEWLTTGRWWRVPVTGCLLMAYFHLHISPIMWWPAAFLALGVIGGPAARDVWRRTCVRRPSPDRELVAA